MEREVPAAKEITAISLAERLVGSGKNAWCTN